MTTVWNKSKRINPELGDYLLLVDWDCEGFEVRAQAEDLEGICNYLKDNEEDKELLDLTLVKLVRFDEEMNEVLPPRVDSGESNAA